jgi:hypothetical protein
MSRIARISHRGETREASAEPGAWQPVLDELIARLGPWDAATSKVELIESLDPPAAPAAPANSTWGEQVMDDVARTRIEEQEKAFAAAGVTINRAEQAYASGTRMADIGYQTQTDRKKAHEKLPLAVDEMAHLEEVIRAEKRHERIVKARDMAKLLSINGALKVDGFKLRENAIRNLVARIESPALRYLLGVRDRITSQDASPEQKTHDKALLLSTLQGELERFGDVELKLRLRDGVGDCFTVVSPTYAVADFPTARPIIARNLPDGARGKVSYDRTSTTWQVQVESFTPTPVQLQAVGEAFRAGGSVRSGDAGFDGYEGGSFLELLRCLNATTFLAELEAASRRHVGNVTRDLPALIRAAFRGVEAAMAVWGAARADVIAIPTVKEELVPIEVAIPGFYRAMLTARKGELVGVLPGRTDGHIVQLAQHFTAERRTPDAVTRADLANGWTAYQQTFPAPVQRAAESAIGSWLSRREPVGFVAA